MLFFQQLSKVCYWDWPNLEYGNCRKVGWLNRSRRLPICVCFTWTGYQAEDCDMVPVNSQSSDAETVLLYPAGLDISVATSPAAGSASDSDTGIADNTQSTADIQHMLPDTDLCDNNLPQSSVAGLAENGK